MRIPEEEDWEDYQYDLDRKWTHNQFIGKSLEEVYSECIGNPISFSSHDQAF